MSSSTFDAGRALEPAGDATVAAREGEPGEQTREAHVEDRAVVAAGLVAMVHASQLLLIPFGPQVARLLSASIHSPRNSVLNSRRSRPRGLR
jgi:hypothetical protein